VKHLDGFGFFVRKAVSKFGYLKVRDFWTSELDTNFRILVSPKVRRKELNAGGREEASPLRLPLRVLQRLILSVPVSLI
jgi:hypothetical protein